MKTLLPPAILSREERARNAVREANKMRRNLQSIARVLTGNPNIKLTFDAKGARTDGHNNIWLHVPPELGDLPEHNVDLCQKRGEDFLQLCPKCRVVENINIILIHEIAHIVHDTFEKVSQHELSKLMTRAIEAECAGKPDGSRAHKLLEKIASADDRYKQDYLNLLNLVSPFLSLIFNACEDMRVNKLMQEHLPGTRLSFNALTNETFANGISSFDGTVSQWSDQSKNAQAIIGLYCKVSGFTYKDWLSEDVAADLDDPELTAVCDQMADAKSARGVYKLCYPLLENLRRLGYCKAPEDVEDDPAPEPEPETPPMNMEDDPDESSDEDNDDTGDADESDDSDGDGSGDPEADDDQQNSDEDGSTADDGEGGADVEDDAGDDQGDDTDSDGSSDDEGDAPDGEGSDSAEDGDDSDDELGDASTSEGDELDEPGEDDGTGGTGEAPDTDEGVADEGATDGDDSNTGENDPDDDSDDGGASSEGSRSEDQDDPDDASDPTEGDTSSEESDSASDGSGDPSDDEASEESDETSDASDRPSDGEGGTGEGEPSGDADDGTEADALAGQDTRLDGPDSPEDDPAAPSLPADDPGQPDAVSADDSAGKEQDESQQPEPYSEEDMERDGQADDIEKLLNIFGGHEDKNDPPPLDSNDKRQAYIERLEREEAIERALDQIDVFDQPSLNVGTLKVLKYEDRDESGRSPWTKSRYRRASTEEPDISESILVSALQRLRLAFQDNARGGMETNLKSGKVNSRVLGKRIATGDPRLFQKKTMPTKKDYFVLVGLDVSGSTNRRVDGYDCLLDLMKAACFAKCELLSRLGVTFAVYAHSGDMECVEIFEIKSPEERWTPKCKEALSTLQPYSANLDGHTLEHYRKVAQARTETDKIILYYTDGAMPLANYEEELDILLREIEMCKRLDIKLVAVGVQNDDPLKYGLDLLQLDGVEDIPAIVTGLRTRLQ